MIDQQESTTKFKAFVQEYRPEIKFVLIFTFGLIAGFFLIYNKTVSTYIIEPITVAETYIAGQILASPIVDYPNRQEGTTLIGEQGNFFRMEVKNNCNGVFESLVFIMAFVAIQIKWRRKIGWVTFGFLLFHTINQMRLVSLFVIGSSYSSDTFVFFHETFWHYALVIVTLGIFLFCADRVSRKHMSRPDPKEKD